MNKHSSGLSPARKIALGYAALAVAGSLLLMMPWCRRVPVHYTDALFTAASASYVTGLTTVTPATTWTPLGAVVIALLIQIGGAGITFVTTLVYLALGRKINLGERKFIAEDKNFGVHGIVRLIKSVLHFSLAIEGMAAVVFALYFHFHYGYPWVRAAGFAAFHAISAFNNAGFDLWGSSLDGFQTDAVVLLLTSVLIILGGLGFVVLAELYSYRRHRTLTLHTRIVLSVTTVLLLSGTALTLLFEAGHSMAHLSWPYKVLNAWFSSVTLRTCGFESVPIGHMRDVTWFVFVLYMFIGASPGSTGGGIKTTTTYTMVKAALATIRGRADIVAWERTIPWDIAIKSLVIFMLSLGVVIAGTLVAAVFEPNIEFIRLLFEVVSAFGTVGLTTGITGVIGEPMKWVLIVTMYIGRIGILTFLVSLSERVRSHARYVEERILIG
ncbi:TrkH family potassium uptake protein [Alicyclobacillus macrosporangiidus]|uniref:Trk system potassium uptake protein TrkH n=1 Tax=Alicyclobacillus macrosporangiidus TaxID=392015 RepID=A0A1I7F6Z6_9BACL|nr:potassium transporter TrkG [Alicyclobacillus macrosporangiidus]SFU31957.1 trk system potassium uptake protein TrkH [Alicyclobacillus macrosporangiidus]